MDDEVVIGLDPHKASNTIAVVDRTERRELVGARTQAACRLHRLLRELVPGGAPEQLTAEAALALLNSLEVEGVADTMRVEVARDHIDDIARLDRKIDDFTKRISTQVKAADTTITRIASLRPSGGRA